ncbi:hypothetical protein [Alphaentomopoxvirus acuprea]|uniref:Uncharacterized protein n=1 Tax=Alphaentomopoxvirus acuprea TaxID=62099 RepID=W6JL22_9POXV|nr:hypothetical protein BA82_gp165 [Anomala cuprea entomopoxvirus]BAO49525.1 hypothetical protein [Anomala cuprea entomopoxvirus]
MESHNLIFILSMDKLVFLLNKSVATYEIIPYRVSFSIIYKNKLIYNNDFYINYNLNNIKTDKNKLLKTIHFNINNNSNHFPTKEREGKKIVRFINNINNNPLVIRNFIRTIYFIFFYIKKEIPLWLSSDYNNIKWIINKQNNNLTTNVKDFEVSVKIIKDLTQSDKYYNSKEINNLLINYVNTAATHDNSYTKDIINLINKLEYLLIYPYQ